MKSTLKVISEKLGINISTVSRALQNHPNISNETKRRVKELAEELDYEPNTFAIRLKTNKSRILGVIVPYISNLFYDSFITAVEEEAKKQDYSVLILQSGESADAEVANLEIIKKNRVDGLMISVTAETNDIKPFLKLQEKGIPIIFFDRVPLFENCIKVCVADKYAAKLAAEALIQKQKKHVLGLFWGHSEVSISKKRLESFKDIFEKKSPQTVLDISFRLNIEEARQTTLDVMQSSNPPDAIFGMGDTMLIGAMQAIHELDLKVPEQVAVISISNGFIPFLYKPKITYIETSGYKLGKLAYSRMMGYFEGNTSAEEVFIDSILIEGGSL